jgi:hypothetical protein
MLNQAVLINVLGHAAGALIFVIFLVQLYSSRGWSGGGRYLSGLAAGLSLVWNLGSLIVLTWPTLPTRVLDIVAAITFSVLSLLPAVLLHVSLGGRWRSLLVSGYLLSLAAVSMHFLEIQRDGASLHQRALLLITIGFLLLTGIAIVRSALGNSEGDRSGGIRTAASMCLALFAMSFVHFGAGHAGQAWGSEVFVHHAGIPLALLVLLQDDRFILLDAFVRFLANALLAAVLAVLWVSAVFRPVLVDRIHEPRYEALLLISIGVFFLIFAWLRSLVQGRLTQAIFRPGTIANLSSRVNDSPDFPEEAQYLDWAAAVIAAAVRTKDYVVVEGDEVESVAGLHLPVLARPLLWADSLRRWNWAEVVIPVRQGAGKVKIVLLGRRQGGQRYLSEDLAALARTSGVIADHLEAMQRQEMKRLVSQAELRALQSQINPHFLFNALNTLYGTIPREAGGARRMVLNLAEVFRYFLQSDRTFVPLAQEMEIVRAYLEVEELRLGDRLKVEVDIDDASQHVPIPVLSVQPLVENAIKHGVARSSEPGYVRIKSHRVSERLYISVENSRSGIPADTEGTGTGLQNVRRRLEICYGSASALKLTIIPERATAELEIPAAEVGLAEASRLQTQQVGDRANRPFTSRR